MKTNIALILSILALTNTISLVLLWCFRSWEVSILGLDTFVGIIVAVLALLFTIAIGYQIINTLDINKKISDLIQRQNTIETNYQNYLKLAQNLQSGISKSTADIYEAKGQYLEAFVFYNWAFYYAVEAGQPNQSLWLDHLRSVISKISNPIVDYSHKKDEILSGATSIRNTVSYRIFFANEYERILNELWRKMLQLGHEKQNNAYDDY